MAESHRICSVDGCNRKTVARGWCDKHYRRWRRHGDPTKALVIPTHKSGEPCLVDGCDRLSDRRGLCTTHYYRLYQYGSLDTTRTPSQEQAEWISRHVSYGRDECLIWPFGRTSHGYATVTYEGVSTTASRVFCRLAHGDPEDELMEAAHSCGMGHKGCVNPRHLRWATRIENEADKEVHGTRLRGKHVAGAKLNEEQVRQIRRLALTERHEDIAAKFGISKSVVSQIKCRKIWAWLED